MRLSNRGKTGYVLWRCPFSDDSGKRKGFHRTTHRANKVAKDAIMQIAASNQRYCASATYYLKKREAGLSHWQAVKCLARQLIRVIFAYFMTRSITRTFLDHTIAFDRNGCFTIALNPA